MTNPENGGLTATVEPTPLSPGVRRVQTSQSRLQDKHAFYRNAWDDLRAGRTTARRFFAQNIALKYRHSSLGLLWTVGPAAVTALALTISSRAPIATPVTTEVSPAFYGVFGLIMAQIFLEAFNAQRTLFSVHGHLMARHNVRIEGLILAALAETGFGALLKLLILVAAFVICAVPPAVTFPLALVGLIADILVGAALGLFVAPINSLKSDFDNAMSLLPWVFFSITPVFFAPHSGGLLHRFYAWNPLAWLFDGTRTLAYGAPGLCWPALLGLPIGGALLLVSWLACRLWRPYVVERFLV